MKKISKRESRRWISRLMPLSLYHEAVYHNTRHEHKCADKMLSSLRFIMYYIIQEVKDLKSAKKINKQKAIYDSNVKDKKI